MRLSWPTGSSIRDKPGTHNYPCLWSSDMLWILLLSFTHTTPVYQRFAFKHSKNNPKVVLILCCRALKCLA